MTDPATLNQIEKDIAENPIILYMKGTVEAPQCGFSAHVVSILQHLEVTFKIVNVLADPNVREAIKKFSNWPTIPQLYIKGEFVGGCDIVKEMYQSGELQALLKSKHIEAA
ncbi:MAG: Grx4 family monothiol glutaredoxin [Alphaproteobacteria bacterium]|nr:Grx4 family monothiol glutaredoxin [Alphaproteobacteria bacterium]